MRSFLEWKFLLGLFATIAGVVVPVYLWRVDLNAYSLRFRIASQTPLQPMEVAATAGLKILVDGQELKSPNLSVVEIMNDGAKPIPASSFEKDLELHIEEDSRILRADVTSTSPKDIRAQVNFDGKSVRLRPLLLNPRDSLTLAIITEGPIPTFQPLARIAGVSNVAVEDATKPVRSPTRDLVAVFISFIFFLAAWTLSDGLLNKYGLLLSRNGAILVCSLLAISGFTVLFWLIESMGSSSASSALLMASLLNVVAMLAAKLLRWAKEAPPPTAANEP